MKKMDPARWQQIEALFHRASERPPGERARFLDEECGTDTLLKKEVLSLLAAEDQSGEFLESPPLKEKVDLDTVSTLIAEKDRSFLGQQVGPYLLEEIIASGGMGTVYRASRKDESFQQKVAVKLIRGGMQSKAIIRRFFRERQVLADLHHPHIAQLLDGGTTRDGDPYLVMEYIPGKPINDYCDETALSISKRLELFRRVCSAVQYAHSKLVVHRDIKPGNILVTREGQPKLLDFGIVKVLESEEAPAEAMTLTIQRIMTPEYASPEQARGSAVSTASDVYSLGIVLYELLTGHRPFRFITTSAHEVERIICEEEPPRPSTAVTLTTTVPVARGETRLITPATVSRTREGRPEKLKRRLLGDLDQIVLKALRKEPSQRYASVQHFSEDIDRHLKGLPVQARKGTLRYRGHKFLKRNRALAILLGVILIVLASAGFFAMQEARRAENLKAAQQVLSFLNHFYAHPLSKKAPRDEVRQTLETEEARRLARDLEDQPEELIRYADTVTRICERFYLHDLTVFWQEIGIKARTTMHASDDRDRVLAYYQLAKALRKAGRFAEAEKRLKEALSFKAPSLAGLLTACMARTLWNQGKSETARNRFEEALQLMDHPEAANPLEKIRTQVDYSRMLTDLGKIETALPLLEEALQTSRGIPGREGKLAGALICQVKGMTLWQTRQFYEAEPLLRKALGRFRQELPESDIRVASCMNDLAFVISRNKSASSEFEGATLQLWTTAWKVRETRFGADSLEVAQSLNVLKYHAKRSHGESMCRHISNRYDNFWPEDHLKRCDPRLWLALNDLPTTMPTETLNHFSGKGVELIQEVLSIRGRYLPEDHWSIGQAQVYLGVSRISQGASSEGCALIKKGFGLMESTLGESHPLVGCTIRNITRWFHFPEFEAADWRFKRGRKHPSLGWPSGTTAMDCDLTMERFVQLDFEDDQAEKRMQIDEPLHEYRKARLWILGKPQNWVCQDFQNEPKMHIRINRDPDHERVVNMAMEYAYLTDHFQWVPFEIPLSWLRPGINTVTLYIAHDANYKETLSWQYNNFFVGIDTDNNRDRSWWFGASTLPCCMEMIIQAQDAEKPLDRESSIFTDHREQGYRECQGELMIFLELL